MPNPKPTPEEQAARKARRQRLQIIADSLTPREAHILVNSPYDANGVDWGKSEVAQRLARRGLIESNPQQPTLYRWTELGESVVEFLR